MICLHQLQPTAAIARLPRDLARRFIASHEPLTRDGTPVLGYLHYNKANSAFPCAQQKLAAMSCDLYAGAGIVRGSDPEQEWQEIDNKAAGLRTLLQME
ncbi:chorismate-binding protein [Escherichia coli]